MGRMFESEADVIQYGTGWVQFFKSFNDKAESIASKYKEELKGLDIFDTMNFNIGERIPIFEEKYAIPEKLKRELTIAFQAHRAP